MQQLHLLKPQILAKLNALLGEGALGDIYLKRGSVAPRPAGQNRAQPPRWRGAVLPAEEVSELRALLAGVGDAELRRELEALLMKQAMLSKARGQG
jgi:hypothetical protein